MAGTCWDILGIEPTPDAGAIRRAYARALKSRRPDEDAESFQRLVEARARALAWHWPKPDEGSGAEVAEAASGDGGFAIRLTEEQLFGLLGRDGADPAAAQAIHDQLAALQDGVPDGHFVARLAEEPASFDSMPAPDLVADPAGPFRQAMARLAAVLRGGNVAWYGPPWRNLMQLATELDLTQRNRLRDAVMRGLLPLLPPLPPFEEAREAYLADRGPATVVDAVEQEFAPAQDQAKLAAVAGAARALLYLGWLGHARRDVAPARRTPGQARVLDRLGALTAAGAPDAWSVAAWRALLALLTGLPPGERDACLGPLVFRLTEALPEVFDETVPVFLSGRSIAAVVELIEQTWQMDGAGRAWLPTGVAVPPSYAAWLLAASRLRATMQRAGEAAYRDANGMPALPPEDCGIWAHPRFQAYWDTARRLGRWPLRFDWQAFLFPMSELTVLGLGSGWTSLLLIPVLLAVTVAAGTLETPPATHRAESAIVLGFLLIRLPAAFLYRWLAVRLAMRRIRRADQEGLSLPKRRAACIRIAESARQPVRRTFEFAVVVIALSTLHAAVRPVDPARVAYEDGVRLEARGQHAKAVAAFDQALQIDPQNQQATDGRAMSTLAQGDDRASEAALTRAIGLDPDNALLFADRAYVLDRQGRMADALADYTRAAALRPDSAAILNNRGAVQQHAGDDAKAIVDFSDALALSPGFLAPLRNRAHSYERLGQYGRAIADDTDALAAGTQGGVDVTATIYTDRGWTHVEAGDLASAVEDLRRAVALAPSLQRARLDLGFAEFDTGAFAQAATDLEAGFQPNVSPYGLLFWHLARSRAGSPDVQGLALRAGSLSATDWPAPVIAMLLGRQTPDDVLAAASTDPQRCEAMFYVGEWHVLHHQPDAAARQFERSLARCPKSYVEYHAADAELHGLRATWPNHL